MIHYALSAGCGLGALVIAYKYLGTHIFRVESTLLGFVVGLGGVRALMYMAANLFCLNLAGRAYLYFRRWAIDELAMTECLERLSIQIDGLVVDAGMEKHPKRDSSRKLNSQHPVAYYYIIQSRKTNEALERLRDATQDTLDAENIPVNVYIDGEAVCTTGPAGRICEEYCTEISKEAYSAYQGYHIPVTLTVYPFRTHSGVYHFQRGKGYSPEFARQ
jgi:hypothetical protein